MSAEAPERLAAVSDVRPPRPGGFVVRRTDYGAFRALEPGSHDAVLLRPTPEGLHLERPGVHEVVAWSEITSLELLRTPSGRARVPCARLHMARGPSVDLADALAPGADQLPFALEAGGPMLLRVERFRLICASVAAGAGLEATRPGHFERGPRALPLPEPAIRARVLPAWAPPFLLVLSVVVLVWVFDLSVPSAIGLTAVVLVHEYGHALAMRLTGMKVRGVLFLPFVGAATLPEHSFRSRWIESWVILAAPATGIPAGLAALALWKGGFLPEEPGAFVFACALGLNLLNLIPLLPLDGGRVWLCLTTAFPAQVRTVLTFAPIAFGAALMVAFVFIQAGSLAVGTAIFLGLGVLISRLHLRRNRFHQWMEDARLDLDAVRRTLRDVTFTFYGAARADVDGGVPPTSLNALHALLVFGVYMTEIVVLFLCTVLALTYLEFPWL